MKARALTSVSRGVLGITIFSCIFAVSLSAKPNSRPEPDYSALDTVVAAELKDNHTPGAVVAVISENKVVYARAFGVANIETQAPMERDTVSLAVRGLKATAKDIRR